MKKCWKCSVEKEVSEFSKGYAQCKSCIYETKKLYRASKKGKEVRKKETINARLSGKKQIRQKKYQKTEKGLLTEKMYREARLATPEGRTRMAAKNAVKYALKKGKIVKLPCFVCGEVKTEAHHPSYAQDMRLCVTWLCSAHHNEIHNPGWELQPC